MRVFLDDERTPPDGWTLVRWPEEAIALLRTGRVEALSLDHDLGDDERGTGYDVVLWLEDQVALHGFDPPALRVHWANSAARAWMEAGLASMARLVARRG
ncbi:MAG: cyclic-phosphate processing receiver domain-containing protein [Planctomycetota bacterium]